MSAANRPSVLNRMMLKSKLHRATVTEADIDYEGSVTLDKTFLEAAEILPFEQVHVWNVTRGTRVLTYAMEGEAGSGVVCVNGAAAHLAKPGDIVIIATFVQMDDESARTHRPRIVLMGPNNVIVRTNAVEIPGPQRRTPLSQP
jgi:aspartate 1-decarboxylase